MRIIPLLTVVPSPSPLYLFSHFLSIFLLTVAPVISSNTWPPAPHLFVQLYLLATFNLPTCPHFRGHLQSLYRPS